jgi:hypothetical protein
LVTFLDCVNISSMQNLLLYRARQLPDHIVSLRTQIAFAAILLVLGMHLVMALNAVAMTLHDKTLPATATIAAPSHQFETGGASTGGLGCCTAATELFCPQSCMIGQATAAVALQFPTVSPLPSFLVGILFHAGSTRTPTPPPRA